MSAEAMGAVFKWDIPSTTKLVALAIADHCDDDGVCWPGARGLAKKTGLDDRTVRRHIADLERLGKLRREARFDDDGRQRTNLFVLVLSGGADTAVRGEDGASVRGEGVTGVRVSRARQTEALSFEPSIEEPSVKKKHCSPSQTDGFDVSFWPHYPRRQGKAMARKAWVKLSISEQVSAVECLPAFRRYKEISGEAYPLPATFLNGRRFDDDFSSPRAPFAAKSGGQRESPNQFEGKDYGKGDE